MSKIHIQQIPLINGICTELDRQHPGIAVNPRTYNVLIKAANDIVAAVGTLPIPATPGMGLDAWLKSDDVGASSLFMACVLGECGIPEYAIPHDADDFDRCVKLLEAVPELISKLPQMAQQSSSWAVLVGRWNEFTELYKREGFYEVLHEAYSTAHEKGYGK